MSDLAALPPHVRTYLRGYELRRRRLAVISGAGKAASFLLGTLLVAALADRLMHFASPIRWTLLACAMVGSGWLLLAPLLRMLRPEVDWLAAAAAIEARNPLFSERLLTVASQLLGRSEYRGSDELLDQLAFDLNRDTAGEVPAALLPARRVVGPWLLLLALAGVVVVLGGARDLDLPQLLLRTVAPWLPIEPITTTRIAVLPGNLDVQQGTTVRLEAVVRRLGSAPVVLHLAEGDAQDYRRVVMTAERIDSSSGAASRPTAAGSEEPVRFAYTLQSVDRDVRYFVTAGDASSKPAEIRVLRRPAIAEMRARYVYPAYVGRVGTTAAIPDFRIEVPAQTEVELTIVATEPLKAALIGIGGEKQLMHRPAGEADERVRVGRFTVTRDARLEVDLISTRDQTGSGPTAADVRVVPDRAPVVRLNGGGQTYRLGVRDFLPLTYEAIDDFGVDSLMVRVQAGSQAAVDFPVVLPPQGGRDDRRRREGYLELDLAELTWSPGDLATVSVVARDSGGRESIPTVGDTITVLASPRSVGLDAAERAAELESAAQLVESAVTDMEQAAGSLADSEKSAGPSAARASRKLSAASGAMAAARRALIRAAGRDPSPELSRGLPAWVDGAQYIASFADGLFREAGGEVRAGEKTSPRSRAARSMLAESARQLVDQAKLLQKDLRLATRGERAETLLADLENVALAEKRLNEKPATDRQRQVVQRLREDVQASLKVLGVGGSSNEIRKKLKDIVDEAVYVERARASIDFLPAVEEWTRQIQRNEWRPITLDERLLAVAQTEATRPRGDGRIARDLNLAGRAAAAIEASGDRNRPVPVAASTASSFAAAMRALLREHRLWTADAQNPPPDAERNAIVTAAEQARRELAAWAGESSEPAGVPATAPAVVRQAKLELIVLAAGAEVAGGNLAAAIGLDEQALQLVGGDAASTTSRQAIERSRNATDDARRAEELRLAQSRLRKQMTEAAKSGKAGDDAVREQQQLAVRAAQSALAVMQSRGVSMPAGSSGTTRDRTAAAYVVTLPKLASLIQLTNGVSQAVKQRIEAADRLSKAIKAAQNSPQANKASLERAAENARQKAAGAASQVDQAMAALVAAMNDPAVTALTAGSEESAVRDVMRKQLAPSIKAVVDLARGDDLERLSRAVQDANRAVDEVRQSINAALDDLALSDPLAAAKWRTQAAAEAMTRQPFNVQEVDRHQRAAEMAFSAARDRSIRFAAMQRVAAARQSRQTPNMAWSPAMEAAVPEASRNSASVLPGFTQWMRDWRRVRPRAGDETPSGTNGEVPGYEAQIKAYFDALGKSRQ